MIRIGPLHVIVRQLEQRRGAICREILGELPDWFGIPESVDGYAADAEAMPMFVVEIENTVAAFVVIRHHSPHAAEIQVLAVRPAYHRRGLGKTLIEHVEQLLRADGVEFLSVKTLSPSTGNEHYARTHAFYLALGFRHLEEFPTLWGEKNPCLMMIKTL